MKKLNILFIVMAILTMVACAAAADDTSSSSTDSDTASTNVMVTNVTYDPVALMPGDTGTVTITIKNTGDSSVGISNANIYSSDITVLNEDAYDTVGYIGPGNTMAFTFSIKAGTKDGIYYPRFYLDFSGSKSLSYYFPVIVDSSGLSVSVIDSPDGWQKDVSDEVTIRVGNGGESTADGVTVYVGGDGISSTQTSYFVGALEPNEYEDLTFTVSPSQETDLNITADWKNGMNQHSSAITIPVVFGEDKTGADLIINNVDVSGGTVTGDVSNAGLEEAYSVIVTVGSPAEPAEPYKQYVLGSLEPDDFSSFEVTYSLQGSDSSFPVIISWKDEDGNDYSSEYEVSGSSYSSDSSGNTGDSSASSEFSGGPGGGGMGGGMMGGMGSGFANIPILEIIIVVIAICVIAFAWKKGYLSEAVKSVKEKLGKSGRK